MSKLDSLPDDVLFLIMDYLEPDDRISLASSAVEKFGHVYREKLLVTKSLNLSRNFSMNTNMFRSLPNLLSPKMRSFDVSGCSWVSAEILLDSIVTMSGLEELIINDTQLCLVHLPAIFHCCPRIKCLAFSYFNSQFDDFEELRMDVVADKDNARVRLLQTGFSRLTSLKVTDSENTEASFWFAILRILTWCRNCVDLRLEPNYSKEGKCDGSQLAEARALASNVIRKSQWIKNLRSFVYVERGRGDFHRKMIKSISSMLMRLRLPSLERFCVQLSNHPHVAPEFLSSILCRSDPIHLGGEIRRKKMPDWKSLTHISGIKFSAETRIEKLQSCSGYCQQEQVLDSFCHAHPSLKQLAVIDVTYLGDYWKESHEDWTLPELDTLEMISEDCCCRFTNLVDIFIKACPNVRHLKIVGTDEVCKPDTIERIGNLKKLKILKIETDKPKPLKTMFEACQELECFHLWLDAGFTYATKFLEKFSLPSNIREFAINWCTLPLSEMLVFAQKWTHVEILILQFDLKLHKDMGSKGNRTPLGVANFTELFHQLVTQAKNIKYLCLIVWLEEDQLRYLKNILQNYVKSIRPGLRFYIGPYLGHSYYPYQ